MEFKDYYAALGVSPTATAEEIKAAYRKLARKFHPDVSKEANAEARFKEVAEAYKALNNAEKRAAYDDVVQRYKHGAEFEPPPGWDSGYEFSARDFGETPDMGSSDFFEALFGQQARHRAQSRQARDRAGEDHHAKVQIDLKDAYQGGHRNITLQIPVRQDDGRLIMQARHLDVNIPRGIANGQHLRLAGQGEAGHGDGPAGDLYLEIEIAPHPLFRVDGRDVYTKVTLAPWEAALGAKLNIPTPEGTVALTVPPDSKAGRTLRLKAKGLPGFTPGDLYVDLSITLPLADTANAQAAYRSMANAFVDFNPRQPLEV